MTFVDKLTKMVQKLTKMVQKLTKMVQKLTKQAAEAYRDSPYEAVSWTRKQDYP